MKVLIGCDPEVFVKDKSGKLVSAHGLIPGNKNVPHKVENGAIQVDGMALEFNTDPTDDVNTFSRNVGSVLKTLRESVRGHELVIEPVAFFDKEVFDAAPDEAKALGCTPDYNTWTGEVNPAPNPQGEYEFMRTASGHIHIGWCEGVNPEDPAHYADCMAVVKQLDYYVGMWSLLWDPDNRRRAMYGKAGAFRPKSYGVEYRTPSNMWLKDDKLTRWVFHAAQQAVSDLAAGKVMESTYNDTARKFIDGNYTSWYADGYRYTNQIKPPMPRVAKAQAA